MSEVTRILEAIEQGIPQATEQLFPLVYGELRRLAAAKLAHETPGHTLQPTALVHEVYVRLVDVEKAQAWKSRAHFFAAAAEAMRRILVENARHKHRAKWGGQMHRVKLDEAQPQIDPPNDDLLALDEALDQLAREDPQGAELVKLRYFAGLTMEQAAELLGIAPRTAYRTWAYARAWLFRRLQGVSSPSTEDSA